MGEGGRINVCACNGFQILVGLGSGKVTLCVFVCVCVWLCGCVSLVDVFGYVDVFVNYFYSNFYSLFKKYSIHFLFH